MPEIQARKIYEMKYAMSAVVRTETSSLTEKSSNEGRQQDVRISESLKLDILITEDYRSWLLMKHKGWDRKKRKEMKSTE